MNLIQSIASPAWAAGFRIITSRCEGCHRSLALRHLATQKAGIAMDGCWYCSSACLKTAAERKLSDLLSRGQEPVNHVSRMPLGLMLIGRSLVTAEQLREATDEQKEAGGEIGEILARHGFVSEKQVTGVRAVQWSCPVFSVPKHPIQTGIQIPFVLMQLYSAIPLHYVPRTKRLFVGFIHGIEYGLLYAIEQMTGCNTQPCFVTPSDFETQMQLREQMQELCGDTTPKELTFESVQTPAEMAQIVCSQGVDLEADEVTISRCREYLWARLTYGAEAVDLFFRAG
jgi:hypothetical protein